MKTMIYSKIVTIFTATILCVCFLSCSSDDNNGEFGFSGDLSNILTQYGWTSDYNDNYLIGDDYINVTTDAGTLFFLENGEGIERYERHDYDTDLGSSSKTTPVPFTYTVNGSTVTINWPTIRSVSYSHSESYRYQNGALIPLDANVVGGYKSSSILSSDRKWLEDAKYYVMDDDERLNIDITLNIKPKGSDNDGYYIYEFHMKVPASAKAEVRKISSVRATFRYPDNTRDRVTLIISGNNTDSSVSGYLYVKESSLPGTMHVQYEVFDNKNAYAYEYIKSAEYELTADGNVQDNNDTTPLTNIHEKPTHSVTLSSYHIGETEVTQALWQAVMGSLPSDIYSPIYTYLATYDLKGAQHPVYCVSWEDCQTFITKLNQLTGQQFHLPTEAQWEYAARGGNKSCGYKYSGSNDIWSVAWDGISDDGPHDVKTKQPNELGIYDMSGNAMEWCQDWYGAYTSSAQTNPTGASSGTERVMRGGSSFDNKGWCRVSFRLSNTPSARGWSCGMRLAL